MIINYKISNQILENVAKFSGHSAKINLLEKLNFPWMVELKNIIINESAKSATSFDVDNANLWSIKSKEKNKQKNNTELENYISALEEFVMPKELKFIDQSLLEQINSLCVKGNTENSKIRKKSRVIKKTTIIDNLKREVEIKVKLKSTLIPPKIKELLNLANATEINKCILSALVHLNIAQIQPFEDGNGRLARIVSRMILNYEEPFGKYLLLEDYFLKNYHLYFDLIEEAIEKRDASKWIEFYISGLLYAVEKSLEILRVISAGTIDLKKNALQPISFREKEIIDKLLSDQQLSPSEVSRSMNMTRQAASKIMQGMLKKKILEKIGSNTNIRYKLKIIDFKEYYA